MKPSSSTIAQWSTAHATIAADVVVAEARVVLGRDRARVDADAQRAAVLRARRRRGTRPCRATGFVLLVVVQVAGVVADLVDEGRDARPRGGSSPAGRPRAARCVCAAQLRRAPRRPPRLSTAMRIRSAPAASRIRIWRSVASRSRVRVAAMLCTAIGTLPPIERSRMRIVRVLRGGIMMENTSLYVFETFPHPPGACRGGLRAGESIHDIRRRTVARAFPSQR